MRSCGNKVFGFSDVIIGQITNLGMKMGRENRLFSPKENFAYRAHLLFLNIAAAMDINQLILVSEGRVDEMILTRVEQVKQQRYEEIQRRKV